MPIDPTEQPDAGPPLGRVLSVPQFWALMGRWRVPDPAAVQLISFPTQSPRSGKRPRFRMRADQKRVTSFLAEVDAALTAAGYQPEWLHHEIPAFDGLTPIELMIRDGVDGAAEVLRALNRAAMERALEK